MIIKSRSGEVLYEDDADTIKATVENAVRSDANISYADLRNADLRNAGLGGAGLGGADLRNADLGYADLRHADLGNADLRNADLRHADLRNADLGHANLGNANLRGTNLRGTNLRHAYLGNAYLGNADLRGIFISWASHDLISQILWNHADTTQRQMLAAFVGRMYEWCWNDFKTFRHREKSWAIKVLREVARDDDENVPEMIRK